MPISTASSAAATLASGGVQLPEAVLQVYSRDIEHFALPVLRFSNFAVSKTELSTMPGQTVVFTKYNNISTGGQLTENVDLVPTNLSATTHSITVYEWGNAVAVTEALLQYSFDAIMTEAAFQLSRDFAVVRDKMNRDALATTLNTQLAGGAGSLGAISTGLTKSEILDITETLATNNAPTFPGDYYIGFIHPHQATQLKQSSGWENAQLYAQTDGIFLGELGRMDNVRFIRTTHVLNGAVSSSSDAYDAALDGTGASSVDLYRALFCGDNAYGEAMALPVEMRHDGVNNFGRRHALAWYSIMGADILDGNNSIALITA